MTALFDAALSAPFLIAAAVILGGTLVTLYVTRWRGSRRRRLSAPHAEVHGSPPPASPALGHPSGASRQGSPHPAPAPARFGGVPASGAGSDTGSPGGPAATQAGPSSPDADMAHPPNVSFADIAGLDDAVAELREIGEFLSDPRRYQALGAELPHGILLYGAPGCGKTLMARALAGEAGVPFFSTSAASFVERYVGTGASRVRELFEQATEHAPSIVFIDELDAVGRERSGGAGGDREYDQTLNQLLVELDGFDRSADVLLVGATNRPELIDSALLRPGRFDRRVHVDQPDQVGREQILRLHAAQRPFSRRVDWEEVAASTAGLSAAELASIVNEAALLAARRYRDRIAPEDLDEACERVVTGGTSSSRLLTPAERRVSAVHEAGHAVLSLLVTGMRPPSRVSIVGSGATFDRSVWDTDSEQTVRTRHDLLAQLIVLLGGRAAEQHAFGEPSTRAEDDLEHAAGLARRMVERWAMTGRYELAGDRSDRDVPYAEGSAGAGEVRELVAKAERAAGKIIADHETAFRRIAKSLAAHETLNANELRALVDDTDHSPTALRRADSEGVRGAIGRSASA